MALRRSVDATVEPVTLTEVKDDRRIVDTASDTKLTTLITVARRNCEDLLLRTLLQTTWELTLDEFPEAIPLRMPRVIDVTSVQYVDPDGDTQTLSAASYQVDDRSEPGWIVPAYGYSWPTTREQPNALTVTYRCGYGTTAAAVPPPIKQWILLRVGDMYENRESEITGLRMTHAVRGFVDDLIAAYRVWEP